MSSLSNPCLIEVAADRIDSDSAIQAQDVLAVSCCGVFRQLHSQMPRETVRCPQQPVLPLTSLHFEKCACVNTPRLEFAISCLCNIFSIINMKQVRHFHLMRAILVCTRVDLFMLHCGLDTYLIPTRSRGLNNYLLKMGAPKKLS